VALRRFGDAPTTFSPAFDTAATLIILPDRSSHPWKATIQSTAPVNVCRK
jgi:hypothetical protein